MDNIINASHPVYDYIWLTANVVITLYSKGGKNGKHGVPERHKCCQYSYACFQVFQHCIVSSSANARRNNAFSMNNIHLLPSTLIFVFFCRPQIRHNIKTFR